VKKLKPDICLVIVNYTEIMKPFYINFFKDVIKKKIPIIILPAYESEIELIKIVNKKLKSLKFMAIN